MRCCVADVFGICAVQTLGEEEIYTEEELAEFDRQLQERMHRQKQEEAFAGHAQPGEIHVSSQLSHATAVPHQSLYSILRWGFAKKELIILRQWCCEPVCCASV